MSNVFETIAAVKRDLGAVEKNGRMEGFGQSYKFRGIDDVINALHTPLHTHGLVIAPKLRSITQEHEQGNKKNQTRTVVEFEWLVAGPEGDSFIAATSGEAMDTQDKGSNKAGTAAYKQLLTQLLAIPFETEDPDNYQPNPPSTSEDRPKAAASKATGSSVTREPAPKAEKSPEASGSAVAPAASGSNERKCATCTYVIGANDPIKRAKGEYHHKACLDGEKPAPANKSEAPSADDIASIIDNFPGTTEA